MAKINRAKFEQALRATGSFSEVELAQALAALDESERLITEIETGLASNARALLDRLLGEAQTGPLPVTKRPGVLVYFDRRLTEMQD